MQARAILEAALNVEEQGGKPVELEIMIPLVGFKSELDFLAGRAPRAWRTPSPRNAAKCRNT